MDKNEILKSSINAFLNQKGPRNDEEVNQFLQVFQSSSELNELLEVIDVLEKENLDNMNQVISMSKRLDKCLCEPLEQINSSFDIFNRDANSFQDIKTKFDESYSTVSENLIPITIKEKNIDLASKLYKELKIGLEEMLKFKEKFFVRNIKQDALKDAVNNQLDKILVCYDYFQQTTNQNAIDIFNQEIRQLEDEIVHTFQIEIDSFQDYDIFFDKFDQEKYKKAKTIKEEILEKIYESEFSVLRKYQNIELFHNSKGSEQFALYFLEKFSSVLSSFSMKYHKRNPPNSFSQGVIHIFENIFSNVVEQLQSNDKFDFSFLDFYNTIQNLLNKKNYQKDFRDKVNKIIQPVRVMCSKELIEKWNKEIETKIIQSFSDYENNLSSVFEKTKKYVDSYISEHNDDSDIISNSVYSEFQGKYIIKEVYEIIYLIETDYISKLMKLYDQNNPEFSEFAKLLVNQSNLIIEHLTNLYLLTCSSEMRQHKRKTILIIFNTHDAISLVVSKFCSKEPLPFSELFEQNLDKMMRLFAPNNSNSSDISEFFQYIQKYLVTDSMKMRFTSLFAEYSIFSYTNVKSSDINDCNLKKYASRMSKIYENSIRVLKDTTNVKKLCNNAIAFFKSPQNSTMYNLISSIKCIDISKRVEPKLLPIVNKMQK